MQVEDACSLRDASDRGKLHTRLLRRVVGRPGSLRWVSVVLVLIAWQVVGSLLPPIFISTPTAVAGAFVEMLLDGSLMSALRESLTNLLIGYAIGASAGIVIGLGMGRSWVMESIFEPYINVVYSSPKLIFIPVLIVFFGLGMLSKVSLIVIATFFSVAIPVYQAVRYVDRKLLEVGRSFNVTPLQEFTKIILPYLIPYLVTGLRLAIGDGVIAMVNAELYLRATGIGGLLQAYGTRFRTDGTMAILIIIACTGLCCIEMLKLAERRVSHWRTSNRG